MPKRSRITFSSFGDRVFKILAVSSRTLESITASTGEATHRTSIKSPSADSPSPPTGVSSDTGQREMVLSFWTFSTGMSMRRPISSLVGTRPSSFSSSRVLIGIHFVLHGKGVDRYTRIRRRFDKLCEITGVHAERFLPHGSAQHRSTRLHPARRAPRRSEQE